MRKTKKALTLLLAGMLVIGMTGCGNGKPSVKTTKDSNGNTVVELNGLEGSEEDTNLTDDGRLLGGYDSGDATEFEVGKKMKGRLDGNIVAWYSFTAPKDGEYDIYLKNESDNNSIVYCIYDNNIVNVTGNKEVKSEDEYTYHLEDVEKDGVYYVVMYSILNDDAVTETQQPTVEADFTLKVSRK